ncbi:MAG: hypothetical protein WBQ44_19815 [Rhodococcus sp. (in: high G+C Gram-positive bacteria)]
MASQNTEPLPVAPYSLELLADLHAGALPQAVSDRLWPLVLSDARAAEDIAALDAVSRKLFEAGSEYTSGESIPPEVAERIDRALESIEPPVAVHKAEPIPSRAVHASVVELSSLSRRRMPRSTVWIGVGASAAALVAVVSLFLTQPGHDNSTDVVADAPELVLDADRIDASVAYEIMATGGSSDLIDAGTLPDCLAANGFDRNSPVLGASTVELDGRRGVMLVLSRTAPSTGLTLLAVDAGCSAGNPGTLVRRDID